MLSGRGAEGRHAQASGEARGSGPSGGENQELEAGLQAWGVGGRGHQAGPSASAEGIWVRGHRPGPGYWHHAGEDSQGTARLPSTTLRVRQAQGRHRLKEDSGDLKGLDRPQSRDGQGRGH